MSYFEILKVPFEYNINMTVLTGNYLALQRDAEVDSGLLNEAYSVLKNDVKRAEYFLSQHQITVERISPELAIKMFEMREQYALITGEAKRIEFQHNIKRQIKNLVQVLKASQSDLAKFTDIFSEVKFLNSFLEKERLDVYSRD